MNIFTLSENIFALTKHTFTLTKHTFPSVTTSFTLAKHNVEKPEDIDVSAKVGINHATTSFIPANTSCKLSNTSEAQTMKQQIFATQNYYPATIHK